MFFVNVLSIRTMTAKSIIGARNVLLDEILNVLIIIAIVADVILK